MVAFVVKAVVVGASTFASAYFGLSRSMPAPVALLCGLLLEGAFLWAYMSFTSANDLEQRDYFDLVVWGIVLTLFGLFIATVGIETISTLANIKVPLISSLSDAGAVIFVCALGLVVLTVVATALTSAINVTNADVSKWSLRRARKSNITVKTPEAKPLPKPEPTTEAVPAFASDAPAPPALDKSTEPIETDGVPKKKRGVNR